MADLFSPAANPPPRPGRHYRTPKQRQDDTVAQIKAARNLREIAYEQADRADGERRARLLRRAAFHSEVEGRLLGELRVMGNHA